MKELNKGRYEIILDGQPKEIVVSFGVKSELYKIISRGQLESAKLSPQVYMAPENHQAILAITKRLTELKADAPDDTASIAIAEAELDIAYAAAIKDLEARQREALGEAAMRQIDLTGDIMAEGLSCLLSERDDQGKIVNAVSTREILWSPVYAEAAEELMELLTAVVEYITSALKKISNLKVMIDSTVSQPVKSQESSQTSE